MQKGGETDELKRGMVEREKSSRGGPKMGFLLAEIVEIRPCGSTNGQRQKRGNGGAKTVEFPKKRATMVS